MSLFADRKGTLYALFRSATESVHRDIYKLVSHDKGKSFDGDLLHKWNINACPMSSMNIEEGPGGVLGAWETGGQVYFAKLDAKADPIQAPGEPGKRKHPRLATNSRGETILAWTEGTGWQKGGSVAYQMFDASGKPKGDRGTLENLAAWNFAAVVARADGGFTIIY
jgi:hypothetical protein